MQNIKIVPVCSLKGGVGKTTISIGLAKALRDKGYSVGILDLDYRTPNIPVALDNGAARLDHTYDGDVLIPPVVEGLRIMSMAYIWPDWKCVQVEDSDAMEDVLHLLTPGIIDWGNIDYLVVDTPPTSTGVVRVALEASGIVGAIVVTHSSRVSRMDAVRTIDLFAEKEVPIIGLVCNQSISEDGELRYDLSPDDIKKVAQEYNIPYLGTIPHSRGDLSSYFSDIADVVLLNSPVTLKIKEPDKEPWSKLLSLTRLLSGSEKSSS
mgnify:CR=1 FL=1